MVCFNFSTAKYNVPLQLVVFNIKIFDLRAADS